MKQIWRKPQERDITIPLCNDNIDVAAERISSHLTILNLSLSLLKNYDDKVSVPILTKEKINKEINIISEPYTIPPQKFQVIRTL